jgi:hypothetical protein
MQNVMETTPKVQKAFYAVYLEESGYLTRNEAGAILFLAHGSTTPHTIEPEDVCWLAVCGEVGTATAQFVADQLAGGYAAIACGREEGRA